MITRQKAYQLRAMIEKAADSLNDTDALKAVELFRYWKDNTHYERTENELLRVRDPEDGYLYKLIPLTHDSQSNWMPHQVPAIWRRVDEPGEEWPEWRQPLSAEDAYAYGAKVSHNDQHWISTVEGNVWEPGVYGWELANE